MPKAALKDALKDLEIEEPYRSPLEKKVAGQLRKAGIGYDYEGTVVKYQVPAREAKYVADFPIRDSRIIIEAKGRFGHRGNNSAATKERHKYILLKEQHPELDIRFVFQRAETPIYKGSKTTHGQWATDHGFKWSDRGIVPLAWIEEMKQSKPKKRKAK